MKSKKKKAFTLVELLAVIVILAVILIIAVPQIMKTIDSARLGSFKSTAKLLLSQAEKQHLVDQTLKVDEGSIGTTTYQGTGNGDTECGKLAKLGSDYSACKVTVDSEGKATLETLTGANKFANYSCTNATLSNVDNVCNKGGSSPESVSETVGFTVSTARMNIGQGLPNGVVRTSEEAAMADWITIAGSTKPFYLKHELGNDATVWCINGSDGSNTCNDGYSLQSQSECNDELQNAPDNGVTYSCGSETGKVITASYVCFERNNRQYCIKGGDGGAAFLSNTKIIYDAFEGTGCSGDNNLPATYDSSYNPNPTSNFHCSVSDLHAYTYSDGHVNVGDGRGDYHCYVSNGGFSNCVKPHVCSGLC